MGKKSLIFTIAALSLICLSGCHKDKPVTKTEPLETIAPETQSETISDKLDETSADIEISPGMCEALCCPWQRAAGTRGRVT